MAVVHRVLSLGLVPLIALIAMQLYSPNILRDAWNVLLPYLGGSLPYHDPVFPGNPPRSDTPLFISSITHWSHFEKIAKVAVAVAELGYPITLITGRIFEDKASALHPNIKFHPLQGQDDKLTGEQYAALASMSPKEAELFMMKIVLVEGMPTTHDTLQQVFRNFRAQHGDDKPLLSFYDMPVTGHLPILLGASGIKPDTSFAIACHPIALDSNDTYPFQVDKMPETGPDARAIHWKAYQDRHENHQTRELDLAWWAKLRDMGAIQDEYPSILHAMASLPEHLMTMGIPEFEWPRTDLRDNIHYFGALKQTRHSDKKMQKLDLPDWWDDVTEAKAHLKKIIVVSQGTVETNLSDLLLPTLEALKDREDVLVIASTVVVDPEEVPGWTVRGNARVTKFVPYELLLPITDVLINNGGYGAVMTALDNGVPTIVAGTGQDKVVTNNLVEYTGVGINLRSKTPSVESIREAVDKVLDDGKYKFNAAVRMSKKFEEYDVGSVFDGVIQEEVRKWVERNRKEQVLCGTTVGVPSLL